MTLLKRSKREERPLLLSERPVLSDSCEDEGSKKKWKLFGKKSSATKNRKEEVIGWEPAPYFPKALQQTEQPRQKIKDNATTERLLEQQQKQKQEASKDDTTASITTARTNQSMSGPVTFNAVRRKANDKPLPQTATVLARSFGREASLLKGCTVSISLALMSYDHIVCPVLTFSFADSLPSSGWSKYLQQNGRRLNQPGSTVLRFNNGFPRIRYKI